LCGCAERFRLLPASLLWFASNFFFFEPLPPGLWRSGGWCSVFSGSQASLDPDSEYSPWSHADLLKCKRMGMVWCVVGRSVPGVGFASNFSFFRIVNPRSQYSIRSKYSNPNPPILFSCTTPSPDPPPGPRRVRSPEGQIPGGPTSNLPRPSLNRLFRIGGYVLELIHPPVKIESGLLLAEAACVNSSTHFSISRPPQSPSARSRTPGPGSPRSSLNRLSRIESEYLKQGIHPPPSLAPSGASSPSVRQALTSLSQDLVEIPHRCRCSYNSLGVSSSEYSNGIRSNSVYPSAIIGAEYVRLLQNIVSPTGGTRAFRTLGFG
jgi:hypothetical protein